MSPELPPPEPQPERSRGDPRFGAEAARAVEGALHHLGDADEALRILTTLKEAGAGFAAYLLLPDTNLAAADINQTFYDTYVDGWETFAEFRRDVLEGLGWTDALQAFMTQQAIPPDHLTWNVAAVDARILETYDTVHLDGWWHIFYK
ncbi:hypothetical protein [Microbacterium paludicola]|uniref:hypothetical protein n=1 Tax=Microbacterium paludicola TaxID=300019 RepID=UPI00090452AE|nr:hypothetical protein [Microbacterium paludicola]APF32865.1 hypothetical protein BO218_00510 [Microbacterium paludicola]